MSLKIFDGEFPYKRSYFEPLCLPANMAAETAKRPFGFKNWEPLGPFTVPQKAEDPCQLLRILTNKPELDCNRKTIVFPKIGQGNIFPEINSTPPSTPHKIKWSVPSNCSLFLGTKKVVIVNSENFCYHSEQKAIFLIFLS